MQPQRRLQWEAARARLPGVEGPSKVRPARSIHERTPVTRGVLCLPGPRPTPFSCPGGARRGGAPQPVTTAERLGAGGDSRAGLPRGLHASFRAPGAGGCGGPREAPLAAPTLGVLALHGAENLIAPPGGRGWGQVPRDLIGAGQSPGRSPETSRSGESAGQKRRERRLAGAPFLQLPRLRAEEMPTPQPGARERLGPGGLACCRAGPARKISRERV